MLINKIYVAIYLGDFLISHDVISEDIGESGGGEKEEGDNVFASTA